MNKNVPAGWAVHELGEITEKIEGGGTPTRTESSYWSGNIPWVTVKDLKKVRLSFAEESISELGLKDSSSRLIPKNTVIIATRMALGKAVVFDKDVAINQDLKAIFPKSNIFYEYLLHWYLSKAAYIQSMGTGSTVKGIRLDDLRIIPINVPPLPEQRKIAAILTAVDDVIGFTQAKITKLENLKTCMMQDLLTNGIGHAEFKDSPVGRIPKSWSAAPLGTVFPKIVVGYVGNVNDFYCARQAGVPFYRTQNIRNGHFTNDNLKYVTNEFNEKNKKSQIFNEDILIARVGANLGMTCKVTGLTEISNIANAIIIKRTKDADSDFFAAYISSDTVQAKITSEAAGGAQGVFNTGLAQNIFAPVPPIDEQKEISKRLTAINFKLNTLRSKFERLCNIRKALMQDLLTGKVRVQVS